jgi:hypothetical protein
VRRQGCDKSQFASWMETLTPEFLAEIVTDADGKTEKTRFERFLGAKEHEMHTPINSCLSSANSASCPTSPVDLTNKLPKCAPRPRKPNWPPPTPKRECPTRRCFAMRRDCATIPPLRRSKTRCASVGMTTRETQVTQEGNPVFSGQNPTVASTAAASKTSSPAPSVNNPSRALPLSRRGKSHGKKTSFRCVVFLGRLYAAIVPRVHFVRLQGCISWFTLSFALVRVAFCVPCGEVVRFQSG